MSSRNESAHALARLQLETPISDDADLLKLQAQVEDFVREAKRRDDPSEPNELVSTVVDTVARNYFRYAILKQRRRVPGTKSGLSEPGCNGRLQIRRDIPPNHRNFLNRNRSKMIRIERGAEVGPGIYEYRVWGTPIFGKSRQPLLDACRQIKAMGGPTKHQRAGVFRKGSTVADISCSVEVGALLTVSEPDKARARFVKYQDFEWAAQSAQRAA